MYEQSPPIDAQLVAGDQLIPVDTRLTSRYSLMVRFLNGNGFKDGAEFTDLLIRNQGKEIGLGPCRLICEPNIDGYAGRIVFLKEVYDLKRLVEENKVVRLQSSFLNVPLVLAHKKRVKREFKNYTSDLTYDLNVYKSLFDKLDEEYAEEAQSIRDSIQMAIINTEGVRFHRFLDDRLAELERMVKGFNRAEHESHGFYFRRQLWEIILTAPFMRRTNLKPRGYAGDSEMMSMIYENGYRGKSTFAKLMHKHPVGHPGAQAVRNRRKVIREMIRGVGDQRNPSGADPLKILSVACGPACEVQDIVQTAQDPGKYDFTLLDQDRNALQEAANGIDRVQRRLDGQVKVKYLNESVRTMLKTPDLPGKWGRFDFVYSMGLFDYLTPPVAAGVLGKLLKLLRPGGELVIGNFHVSNVSRYYMEYWLDWVLYYRTESDLKELLRGAPGDDVSVFFDETGVQMFLHVKRHESH